MTDNLELLQPILDAPEEDAPRLVYADWLTENDQQIRAEFIRLQIRLAREFAAHYRMASEGVAGVWPGEFLALCRRERRLLDANWAYWQNAVTAQFLGNCSRWVRGFIESMVMEWAAWERSAASIIARCPLKKVTLTTWPPTRVVSIGTFPSKIGVMLGDRPEALWVDLSGGISLFDRDTRDRGRSDIEIGREIGRMMTTAALARIWPKICFVLPPAREAGND